MKQILNITKLAALLLAISFASVTTTQAQDPLPSWNDGPNKQAIVDFVKATTEEGGAKFVPPGERIATFDQDGTLWVEHPVYSQLIYCLDRVGPLVKAKPELAKVEPFKTVISGDRAAIAKLPDRGSAQDRRGHALRHDDGGIPGPGETLARRGERPTLEAALYGTDLPADAGGAEVSPRQWL